MTILQKRVLIRFIRAFISGGIGAMVLVIPINIHSLTEVNTWLMALLVAGIVGSVTGVLQSGDLYFRNYNSTEESS